MRSRCICLALLIGTAAAAHGADVRYFFSFQGLSDPGDTGSPAVPTGVIQNSVNGGDPLAQSFGPPWTLYVWAMLPSSPVVDLVGVDLAFRIEWGDRRIGATNLWQNTNGFLKDTDDDGKPDTFVETYRRWNDEGTPGRQVWNFAQSADPAPAFALTEHGITNQTAAQDDQRRTVTFNGLSHRAILIGSVDLVWDGATGIQIVHQSSTFRNPSANGRVYLGLDDTIGAPAGSQYDNQSLEAVYIPEPAGAVMALICLGPICRRR